MCIHEFAPSAPQLRCYWAKKHKWSMFEKSWDIATPQISLAGAARLFWVPTSHQTLFALLATAIQQAETQASNPQHFFPYHLTHLIRFSRFACFLQLSQNH